MKIKTTLLLVPKCVSRASSMRRSLVRFCSTFLFASGLSVSGADNMEIAQERMARMYEIFHDAVFRNEPNSRASFQMLSIGVGTDISPNASPIQLYEIASAIANQRLLANGSRAETLALGPFGPYYKAYLDNHATQQPTTDQQQEMDRLQNTIRDNADAYGQAHEALVTRKSRNFTRFFTGEITHDDMGSLDASAQQTFDSNISVRNTRKAKQDLNRLNASLGDAIWRWRQQRATEGEEKGWDVQTVPALNTLNSENGWTEYELSAEKLDETKSRSESRASASYGGWFFRAKGNYTKITQDDDKLIDKMMVRFKVKRVLCMRNWFDSGTFLDDSYRPIKPKTEMPLLSTGKVDDKGYYGGNGSTGVVPLIITDLIYVKDVTLTAPWRKEHFDFVKTSVSGSGSFGFGPFRIGGGGGGRDWEKTHATTDDVNSSIKITTPQLIGFIVFKVPECPRK